MEILRNITRRKGRSALTIGGILIGILALTVLGAMAEKINGLMAGNEQFFANQILVSPRGGRGGPMGANLYLTEKEIAEIQSFPGVASVMPMITMLIQDDEHHFHFGIPPMIQAMDMSAKHNPWNHIRLAAGRLLDAGERGKVVLGADIATQFEAKVGDTITLNDQSFEVCGVTEKTLSGPDNLALISLEDGREMLLAFQPQLQQLQQMSEALKSLALLGITSSSLPQEVTSLTDFDLDKVASSVSVEWEESIDPEQLTEQLQLALGDLFVVSPETMRQMIRQAMLIINIIIMGAAGIALAVGGLSIINTMMMAVSERTKEIGVKMAVGARPTQIMQEYLCEAAVIGLIGGSLGVGIGSGVVFAINRYTASLGAQVFLVTPRLVILGLAFAVGLGVLAGFYPAYRGAHLHCVQALREE